MTSSAPQPDPRSRAAETSARQDAKTRALRTLLQGLALDVLVSAGAAGLIVLGTLDDNEVFTGVGLTAIGVAVGKSILTAGLSWLARLKLPPA